MVPTVFPVGEGENTFQVLRLMGDRGKIKGPVLGGRRLLSALTISALAPILLLDLCWDPGLGRRVSLGRSKEGLSRAVCLGEQIRQEEPRWLGP